MATVNNWVDHLNKPAEEVVGAVYPGAGSVEGMLVIIGIILWVDLQEKDMALMIIEVILPSGN